MLQRNVTVMCSGTIAGDYAMDLLIEEAVIVELNATRAMVEIHRDQCINYLRTTGR